MMSIILLRIQIARELLGGIEKMWIVKITRPTWTHGGFRPAALRNQCLPEAPCQTEKFRPRLHGCTPQAVFAQPRAIPSVFNRKAIYYRAKIQQQKV
jgi:hypothetical protein